MKRRKDIPTIICRGCGHGIQGEEIEHLGRNWPEEQKKAQIYWTCQNRQCPYGPRPIPVGEHLEEERRSP